MHRMDENRLTKKDHTDLDAALTVAEDGLPVIIMRDGEPCGVIMTMEVYEKMTGRKAEDEDGESIRHFVRRR